MFPETKFEAMKKSHDPSLIFMKQCTNLSRDYKFVLSKIHQIIIQLVHIRDLDLGDLLCFFFNLVGNILLLFLQAQYCRIRIYVVENDPRFSIIKNMLKSGLF